MVAEAETLRLLGVSICAPNAGDLIHEAALALRCGLTVKDLAETVHVFPTLSEAIKLVAVSYFQDVTKMPCCT
jgi:mercuric reductase